MKKLLVLSFILCAFAFISNAQVTAPDLGYDNTYSYYTGQTADTMGVADSIWYYDIRKKTDTKIYPQVYLSLDKLAGSGRAAVLCIIQGKATDGQSYTPVDTISWGVSVDSAFTIKPGVSYEYQYWRLYIKGSNDNFKARPLKVEWFFVKP